MERTYVSLHAENVKLNAPPAVVIFCYVIWYGRSVCYMRVSRFLGIYMSY